MLRNREYRNARAARSVCTMLLFVYLLVVQLNATPVPTMPTLDYGLPTTNVNNLTNTSTDNDLYVIKAIVYEIGILTDADNSTNPDSTERQEQVDISLYDRSEEDHEFPRTPENPALQYSLLYLLNSTV